MAEPAYHGFVESALDALLVIQGCSTGVLPLVTRRLQEREKKATVISGSVFVWDSTATGIKRWTDGLSWSPSRTLGNFLVYRELDKRAKKLEIALTASRGGPMTDGKLPSEIAAEGDTEDRLREKALVGSLTSYKFRKDGLVKKTISLGGLHMIAYYTMSDVLEGRLRTPSSHPGLLALDIHPQLLEPTAWRYPLQTEIGEDGVLRYVGEVELPPPPDPSVVLVEARPASSQTATALLRIAPVIPTLPPMNPYPPPRDNQRTIPRNVSNRYDPYTMSRSPSLSASTFPHSNSHTPHTSPPSHSTNGYTHYASTSGEGRYEQDRQEDRRYERMEQERVQHFADRRRPSSSGGNPVATGPRQWQRGSQVLVRGQSEQGISTSYAEAQPMYSTTYASYEMDQDDNRDSLASRQQLPPILHRHTHSNEVFAYAPPSLADSTNGGSNYRPPFPPIVLPRLSHAVDSYSSSAQIPTYWQRPTAGPPLPISDSRSFSLDSSLPPSHSNSPPIQRRSSSNVQQPRQAPFDGYQALGQAHYPTYLDHEQERPIQSQPIQQQYGNGHEYAPSNEDHNGSGMQSPEHSPEIMRAHLMQRQFAQEEDEGVAMRRRLSEREERQIVTEESRHQEQVPQSNW